MISISELDVDISRVPELGDTLLQKLSLLRDEQPILWSEQSQCWLILGHKQVVEGFSGRLPLSSRQFPGALDHIMPAAERERRIPLALRYTTPWVTNSDKPDHTRLRKLYMKGFSRGVVESLRPFVQERINTLLNKAEDGAVIEFNEEIARPLPGSVILKLLGLPESYLERLEGWATIVSTALGSNQPKPEWLDQYEDAVRDMEAVFEEEVAKRRANPTKDLITDLLQASEDGDQLSHDELIGALQQIIIAGHESTTGTISLTLAALAKSPAHWAELQANPENALQAAMELMRYVAMSASMPRLVAEDFEWEGHQLKKGQVVMLMIAAGNRDPSIYPDPEQLDFSRTNYEILTFGPGLHHCIGHLLAKMQVSELLAAVTQRFDGAELLDELHFLPPVIFRGIHQLRVRFVPRG